MSGNIYHSFLVGTTRLERATPWSQTKYTTNCTTSRMPSFEKRCKGSANRMKFQISTREYKEKVQSFFIERGRDLIKFIYAFLKWIQPSDSAVA